MRAHSILRPMGAIVIALTIVVAVTAEPAGAVGQCEVVRMG